MTEPTRDALRALAHELATQDVTCSRQTTRDLARGYLDLEAEVERLRAKAAIVDAMERGEIHVLAVAMTNANWCIWRGEGTRSKPYWGKTLLAAYAAATREGTSDGN